MSSIKDLFKKKTAEELYIEKEMKNLKKEKELAVAVAGYAGKLAGCRDTFEKTITLERLNVLERRKNRISDAAPKERIHDAAVGLLAVQEAEFELRTVSNTKELENAMKSLEKVLKCMHRLDSNTSITARNLKDSRGLEFDDTSEPVLYSERAALVDERFVERLIQGESLEKCLKETAPSSVGYQGIGSAPKAGEVDFRSIPESDGMDEEIAKRMREYADKH